MTNLDGTKDNQVDFYGKGDAEIKPEVAAEGEVPAEIKEWS